MADIKYSEMSTISGASIDNGSLMAVADVDTSSDTGYSTYATTVLDVATKINKHIQYATDLPTFTNQTIFGALNELKAGGGGGSSWTDVTGTLTAGQTSITLLSAVITTSSTVEIFTSDGTEWNSITVATGSITVTFDAQSSDLGVKARIT